MQQILLEVFVTMALQGVILSPVVLAQNDEKEAEKIYRDFEKKLASAKAYKFAFTSEEAQTKLPSVSRKGEVFIAAGDKLKITFQGKEGNNPFSATFISDGKVFRSTLISNDETTVKTRAAVENQTVVFTDLLARAGMTYNLRPSGGLAKTPNVGQNVKLINFRLAGKERIDGQEVNIVEYDLIGEAPHSSSTKTKRKMWFDAKTKLLLKRTFEANIADKVYTAIEVYSNWDFAPEIKDGEFAVPK
jgi:outer membrane lipoprotein-sorting protein